NPRLDHLRICLPTFCKKHFAFLPVRDTKVRVRIFRSVSVRYFLKRVLLGRFYSSRPSSRINSRVGMNASVFLAAVTTAASSDKGEIAYIWDRATVEAKVIILCLVIFSIVAWTVMIFKAIQMR